MIQLKKAMKPPESWNFCFMKFANDFRRRKSARILRLDDAIKFLRKWIIFLVIWSMIHTGSPRHEMNIDPASVQTIFKYHKTMAIHSPLTAGIDCCYLSHFIFHFIRNFINFTILSLSDLCIFAYLEYKIIFLANGLLW